MSAFSFAEAICGQFDYELIRAGGVSVCADPETLARFVERLSELGYSVAESVYDGVSLVSFSNSLIGAIPMYSHYEYGPGNLNSLHGMLQDLEVGRGLGLLFVIRGFDQAFSADAKWAVDFLDILQLASYDRLLMGQRLIILVELLDGSIKLPRLGGFEPDRYPS
ncbi:MULTISPECIES: hypothetical protein [Actinoplanes]|uniref:hypothetical protein n=1 Tax=Actinoplanes TaxID=1865 RepID=UPI0005F28FEC|nr:MULTISPECIES: hypothetical protein [Actinoplanes]GLY01347.1 hypothetical protein Acsp01_17260 [Actinoplanes sp. NBRC 101535]